VPGHTLAISEGPSCSANWVDDGWRITFTGVPGEGDTITHDQCVSLLKQSGVAVKVGTDTTRSS
jgi:hypothetical protein